MGQQQLFIVILTTIIIGIAIIVAINVMSEVRRENNIESIKLKMVEASNLAQAYYEKPDIIGGGGNSFSSITLKIMNLEELDQIGTFSIDNLSASQFVLSAVTNDGLDTISATISDNSINF